MICGQSRPLRKGGPGKVPCRLEFEFTVRLKAPLPSPQWQCGHAEVRIYRSADFCVGVRAGEGTECNAQERRSQSGTHAPPVARRGRLGAGIR
jgi:hypothetical protein